MSLSIEKFTSSFEVDFGYTVYLIDATNQSVVVSLPNVSNKNGAFDGTHLYVKRYDTNGSKTVSVDPYGSQTIDGSSKTVSLEYNQTIHLVCYDGNWYTI